MCAREFLGGVGAVSPSFPVVADVNRARKTMISTYAGGGARWLEPTSDTRGAMCEQAELRREHELETHLVKS